MANETFQQPLFNTSGPKQFAKEVHGVKSAFTDLGSSVERMATKATSALDRLDKKLTSILGKVKQLNQLGVQVGSSGSGNGSSSASGAWSSSSSAGSGYGLSPSGAADVGAWGGVNANPYGAWGVGGTTTFGSLSASEGSSTPSPFVPMTSAGNGGYGVSEGAGGVGGGGRSSWMAVMGAGVAAAGVSTAGAASRYAAGAIPAGVSAAQARNVVQYATGWNSSRATQYITSPQWKGFSSMSGFTPAMQILNGSAGFAIGTQGFGRRLSQAGTFAQLAANSGQNVSMSQAAEAQSMLSSRQGISQLQQMGIDLAPNAINLYSVAEMADARLNNGTMMSRKQVAASGSYGGKLFNSLMQVYGGNQSLAQTGVNYLEMGGGQGNSMSLGAQTTAAGVNAVARKLGISSSLPAQNLDMQSKKAQVMAIPDMTAAKEAVSIDNKMYDKLREIERHNRQMVTQLARIAGVLGSTPGQAGTSLLDQGLHAVETGGEIGLGAKLLGKLKGGGGAGGGVLGGGEAAAEGGLGAGLAGLALPAAGIAAGAGGATLAWKGLHHKDNLAGGAMTVGGMALAGAGIGTLIAPGVGTLLGGGVGAAAGALTEGMRHLGPLLGLWKGQSSGGPMASSQGGPAKATGRTAAVSGAAVVREAESFIGVPYVWGGTSPRGFDCSGLVQYVYGKEGIALPRTTYQQVKVGTEVPSLAQAQPGDLLFYAGSDGTATNPGHVGIYVGGGKMINAPYTGTDVQIDAAGNPVFIRRVLASNAKGSPSGTPNGGIPSDQAGGAMSATAYFGSLGASSASGAFSMGGLTEGTTNSEAATLAAMLTPTMGSTPAAGMALGAGGLSGASAATAGSTSVTGVGPATSTVQGSSSLTGQSNPQSFALALLRALGDPATSLNVRSIVNWEGLEGGMWHNPDKYNPLNTTQPMPGAVSTNSVGVKAYNSWAQGLAATVQVLNNGMYSDVLGALKSGKGLMNTHLQGLSTWSGGSYSSIPSYAIGSQFVESNQLAMLHRGEMVIRSGAAGAMRMNQLSGPQGSEGVTINFLANSINYHAGAASAGVSTPSGVANDAQQLVDEIQKELQRRMALVATRRD